MIGHKPVLNMLVGLNADQNPKIIFEFEIMTVKLLIVLIV